MSTPYANIGDANQESSFLTNNDGADVAVLSRVLTASVPSYHPTLTDEQWQQVIDLIDAAPDLLAALESILSSTCGDIGDDGYDGCIRIEAKSLDRAREAIAKAKGGAL